MSDDSPMTPPWMTTQHQQYQPRKVSEEDMYQNHHHAQTTTTTTNTTGTTNSRTDADNRDESSSSSSDDDCGQPISLSLSSVSTTSSSNAPTTNLKRRKPSACLTDLVQQEMKKSKTSSSGCAAVSPTVATSGHQGLYSSSRCCETTGNASPSGWWGHFTTTTDDDSYAHEFEEDEGSGEGVTGSVIHKVAHDEECWDFNAMTYATSFIPIQERPHHIHHRRQHYSTPNSTSGTTLNHNHNVRPSGAMMNTLSPHGGGNSSNCSHNTHTSWRMALTANSLNPISRNTDYDHHNHPYMYHMNTNPTSMKRYNIVPLSTSSSHPRSSNDRFRRHQSSTNDAEQLQSSFSFDEFILACPNDYDDDRRSTGNCEVHHYDTDGNIDMTTQQMSVLGL